jgi:hypothetical protein
MSLHFSKIIDRYFLSWICPDTWATYHPLDMERFYKFVKAIKRYARSNYGPKIYKNIIKAARKEHPGLDEGHIREMAEDFSSIVHKILDYELTPFPDPIVEMRNPYEVSLRLRSIQRADKKGDLRPFYTDKQVEEILDKNFGPDWRERSRQHISRKPQNI